MSPRHDDNDPIEHDPTGMRALLGGLPDPGPMPADLVARIEAAIVADGAVEASAAGRSVGAGPGPEGGDGREGQVADGGGRSTDPSSTSSLAPVLPLRRRTAWRVAGVAAAVVVAVGVGGLTLRAFQPGGIVASLGVSEGGSDSSAAGSADGSSLAPQEGGPQDGTTGDARSDDAAPPATVELVMADAGTRVRVVASSGDVEQGAVADVVARLAVPGYDEFPSSSATTSEETGARAGTVAEPAQARACASSLGVPATDEVLVDLTTVGGVTDAALVIATSPSGGRTAWAVPDRCGSDGTGPSPEVIVGPVRVD